MSEHSDGATRSDGNSAARKRRKHRDALKPGSAAASPPPAVDATPVYGRRRRILAMQETMRRNDELKAERERQEAEADG